MSGHDYLVSIDVGTTKICTLVAAFSEDTKLSIVGVGNVPSQGIRRGVVVNIEETISSISASLEEAERMAGYPIESAFVAIGGSHISSLNSRGVIAVSRADGEISHEDVARVIEAAQAISLPMNREVLHVLPRGFIVDGQEGVENPAGMTGVRLEVETHVVNAASSSVRNLAKCVQQTGVEVEEVVLSSLAAAEAVLGNDDKELGVVVLDIGGGTTDIAIFVEGSIWHSAVLPVGSSHITNDIAIGLRIPFDAAEKIKKAAALGEQNFEEGTLFEEMNRSDAFDLADFGVDNGGIVSRQTLNEIIEARLAEIFEMAAAEIKKAGQQGLLAGGGVLVGGGALLPGIVEIAKEYLALPVRIGKPREVVGLSEDITSPVYATSIGLLLWGMKSRQHRELIRVSPIQVWFNAFGKVRNWIKRSFFP
ncbi:MAG TPA: cell division protein FtsA [bacterium]|nr:cell division protein FtsA [bacterium]